MPSLKSINKEAGTNFKRWKEVTAAVTIEAAKPTPIHISVAVGSPEWRDLLEDHPDIAKAIAEGFTLKDVENGRNANRRMGTKIYAASRRYGKRSMEVEAAIGAANRVSVMLTTARAAYNRITYPERYV